MYILENSYSLQLLNMSQSTLIINICKHTTHVQHSNVNNLCHHRNYSISSCKCSDIHLIHKQLSNNRFMYISRNANVWCDQENALLSKYLIFKTFPQKLSIFLLLLHIGINPVLRIGLSAAVFQHAVGADRILLLCQVSLGRHNQHGPPCP